MRNKILLPFVLLFMAGMLLPSPARADGIIIPDPPICLPDPCPPRPIPIAQLAIRYHHVSITIEDQVAVTHVDQVFYNPNEWQVEGTYIFPIPVDAAVSAFTLWVDGQPVEGEVLDAEQARRTYEDIVRSLRDPALLEYAGRGAVQARIFPIPPKGERRIELEYTQALAADNGLVRYVYPLSTEKFSTWPLESVTVNVDIRSAVPIRAVYSPTHNVGIDRLDDQHIRVGYEDNDVTPDTDFALYYSLGEEEAFHLLSYRDPFDPVDPDGFFLLLLAPRPNIDLESIPKDVLLVLDRSGSMDGEKFIQAQEALRYILKHLRPEDRFNIITFGTSVETYAGRLRPADEVNEALAWVDRLGARGSTDINLALLEATAMAGRERPTYVIFLTDGLPTQGVVDSQKILDNVADAAPSSLRLFTFGVGYDVDTFLLDSLAQNHHGASAYVLPGERLDEVISGFYAKISTPVLTDLVLDFGSFPVYDLYPWPLPDLFVGSQIVLLGRYRMSGNQDAAVDVTLSGEVNGERHSFRFDEQLFSGDSRGKSEVQSAATAALPRLWATRKIGFLLNQVRLQGPDEETIQQIVRLSIRYGIVTPYTSYLVTEELPLGAVEQERIAGEQFLQLEAASPEVSGEKAVQRAVEQGALADADSAAAPPSQAADIVRVAGGRAFVYNKGVWIDTSFDPDLMVATPVPFLSEDYFSLVDARPELAAAFALGEKVIALSDGAAYEVVDADTPAQPVTAPPTYTPAPPGTDIQVNPRLQDTPTPAAAQTPASKGPACTGGLLPLALLIGGCLVWGYPRRSAARNGKI